MAQKTKKPRKKDNIKRATCDLCKKRVKKRELTKTAYQGHDSGQFLTIKTCAKCNEPPYPVGMSAAEIWEIERLKEKEMADGR